MNKTRIALSFFKDNNIGYCLDNSKIVRFPCFHCGCECFMDPVTTEWQCCVCDSEGNLVSLVRLFDRGELNRERMLKIYNPNVERKQIQRSFRALINKTSGKQQQQLQVLLRKYQQLIEWLTRDHHA